MKKLYRALFFSCLLLISPYSFSANQTPFPNLPAMLEKTMPAVVNINVQLNPMTYPELDGEEEIDPRYFIHIGSGVIIDANHGYIVTNAHVVRDAKTITVTLNDSRKFTAKLLGSDVSTDLAVLQIHANMLTAIPFANSNRLKVGDQVAAIGSPFGLDQTVTSGIISALGRSNMKLSTAESFIQTDASINRGNSGGALVDVKGELVGINTAILSESTGGNIGIGFAIPSNIAKAITDQIIKFGDVRRGYLGVLVQDLTPALASALDNSHNTGALITSVNKDSPAAQIGIATGDVIIAVNKDPVQSASQLISNVSMLRAGAPLTLTVMHQQKTRDFDLKLASLEDLTKSRETNNPYFYGVIMHDYSELNPSLGFVRGVQIVNVLQDSNAARDGLILGDVILSADLQPTGTIQDLLDVAQKNTGKPLLLNMLRQGGALFVTLQPGSE